ncbi:MAG: hypothetical protein LBJ92_00125 [Holosporales bacterium]|nr:hypothetical protein [Holosporales bacterium]
MSVLRMLVVSLVSISVGYTSQVYQAMAGAPSQMQGQGMPDNDPGFDVEVYVQENGNLVKRHINQSILRKALVVFIGEGCPHCERFLSEFAQHYRRITNEGVVTVFIRIPSISDLQAGRIPTMQEYDSAVSEVRVVGAPSNTIKVFLLADYPSLMRVGITAIPVGFIVNHSKQRLKMEGDTLFQKTDFSDDSVLQSFLEYFKGNEESDQGKYTERDEQEDGATHIKGSSGTHHGSSSGSTHHGVNLNEAKKFTNMLNDGHFDCQLLEQEKAKPVCPEQKPVCQWQRPICKEHKQVCPEPKPVCKWQKPICKEKNPVHHEQKSVCPVPNQSYHEQKSACPEPKQKRKCVCYVVDG